MRLRYGTAAPLALLIAACGTSADPETVLDTVRMTEQARIEAIATKDLAGAVRLYAPEAILIAPDGSRADGEQAIRAAFEELLADPNLAIEIAPGPGWAAESGDLAVTSFTGKLVSTGPVGAKPVTAAVNNQTVWRRAAGATWQIVSDQTVAQPAAPL